MTEKKAKCPYNSGFKYCPESKECKAWKGFTVSRRMSHDDANAPGNIQNTYMEDCVQNWTATFLYDLLFKSLGIQQATESFRDEVVDGGKSFVMSLAALGAQAREQNKQLEGKANADIYHEG